MCIYLQGFILTPEILLGLELSDEYPIWVELQAAQNYHKGNSKKIHYGQRIISIATAVCAALLAQHYELSLQYLTNNHGCWQRLSFLIYRCGLHCFWFCIYSPMPHLYKLFWTVKMEGIALWWYKSTALHWLAVKEKAYCLQCSMTSQLQCVCARAYCIQDIMIQGEASCINRACSVTVMHV